MKPAVQTFRARGLWTPAGLREDGAVMVVGREIVEVRAGRPSDGPALDGLLVPGLVNAHAHLELSARGMVGEAGAGFVAWLDALWGDGVQPSAPAGRQAAQQAVGFGTALLMDVTNAGNSGPWMKEAGLQGIVAHEHLGFDAPSLDERCETARAASSPSADPPIVAAPHALFSTAPALVQACVGASGPPSTIHIGESRDEARFLRGGSGPHADLLDRLGRDWRPVARLGLDAVGLLAALGVLGPRLLLVHGVHLDASALQRAAASGAALCLCPRSNLHVEGRLPDLDAVLRSGVALALGTDSLASSPDLDPLAEVAALVRARPDLPVEPWLHAATDAGADALHRPDLGRLVPGASPGLLLLEGVRGLADLAAPPARRWLVPPGLAVPR